MTALILPWPVTSFSVAGPDARLALRISNALAVISLFLCGFLLGRHAGLQHLATGLVMVGVGVALVSVAVALGG